MAELTRTDRTKFAAGKLWDAFRWIALSGTATFLLTGLLDIVAEVELPSVVTLGIYLIINTAIYGIAKYVEGENGKENGGE